MLEREWIDQNGEISDFREAIKRIMFNHQELLDSYDLYYDFNKYFVPSSDFEEAKLNLEFLIQKALGSTVKEIVTLGETLLNWSDEILNSYSNKNILNISNAVAECNNNRIEKIIDVSYGYGSFQRLRKRVLFIEKEKSAKES